MRKTAYAGVFALVTLGLLPAFSTTYANERAATSELSQTPTSINIDRIKSALRLTPEQEIHWPRVEAALRTLAHRQARPERAGFVRRISRRIVSVVLDGAAIDRLAVAARPLIAALSLDQMRSASGMAQEMGLGPVVTAALR